MAQIAPFALETLARENPSSVPRDWCFKTFLFQSLLSSVEHSEFILFHKVMRDARVTWRISTGAISKNEETLTLINTSQSV